MSRAAMICILVAVAWVFPASHFTAPAASAAPGRCQNLQLHITPVRSSGATGHIGMEYRMHNMWGSSCTLQGYPGAGLLGAKFHTIPIDLHRSLGNLVPYRLVTLGGNGNAYFILEWEQIQVQNNPCQYGRYFMVIPPNANLPDVTYAAPNAGFIRVCSRDVNVSPVSAHPINF